MHENISDVIQMKQTNKQTNMLYDKHKSKKKKNLNIRSDEVFLDHSMPSERNPEKCLGMFHHLSNNKQTNKLIHV